LAYAFEFKIELRAENTENGTSHEIQNKTFKIEEADQLNVWLSSQVSKF